MEAIVRPRSRATALSAGGHSRGSILAARQSRYEELCGGRRPHRPERALPILGENTTR